MDKLSITKRVQKAEIIINAPVTLRGGEAADYYFDVKKMYGENPELLLEIAKAITEKLDTGTTCLAASGYGGLPLGTAVSISSNLPLALVRETEKEHGKRRLIDGYIPKTSDKITIIDDVFTTGNSLSYCEEILNRTGADIIGCQVVVARGNAEKFHLPVSYLFTAQDLLR